MTNNKNKNKNYPVYHSTIPPFQYPMGMDDMVWCGATKW